MATITPKASYTGEPVPAVGSPEYTKSQELAKASLVDRYTPTPSVNPNENKPYGAGPGSSTLIDTGQTRERYRSQAQDTINAIRSKFDEYIKEDTEAKRKLESKANISALLGGRSGSPTGAAEVSKASKEGQARIDKTRQGMEQEIAAVLADADNRASQEFESEREQYLAGQKDRLVEEQRISGNIKAQAEGDIGKWATAGRSYDDWAKEVGPKRVQQYMKETGRDEAGLKALFLHSTPKEDLVSATGAENSDGSRSFYKKVYDEQGNLTGVKEVGRIEGTGGKKIKESRLTDNGVQILYTDGTYEERTKDDGPVKNSKPITGAPKGYTEQEIEKARTYFTQQGTEGFTNPYLYVDSFNDWIAKGGDRLTFIKLFPPAKYINPKHNELKDESGNPLIPLYLKNPAKVKVEVAPEKTTSGASSSGRTY